MSRRTSASSLTAFLISLAMAVAAWSASPAGDQATVARAFLDRIAQEEASGALTSEQAVLYQLYYGFAPERLPAGYRPATFAPLKDATLIIWRYQQLRDRFSPEVRTIIDG